VNGIVVNGVTVDLLVFIEDTMTFERAGAGDVTVCKDESIQSRLTGSQAKQLVRMEDPFSESTTNPVA
jgi:hypothetical protein